MGRLPPVLLLSPEGAKRSGAPRRRRPARLTGAEGAIRSRVLRTEHPVDSGGVSEPRALETTAFYAIEPPLTSPAAYGLRFILQAVGRACDVCVAATRGLTSRFPAAERAAAGMHANAAPPTPRVASRAWPRTRASTLPPSYATEQPPASPAVCGLRFILQATGRACDTHVAATRSSAPRSSRGHGVPRSMRAEGRATE